MSHPSLWTRRRISGLCVLATIGALQAGAAVYAARLVASLLAAEPNSGALADAGTRSALVVLLAAAALVTLRVFQRWLAERFALTYVAELRAHFVSHAMRLPANGPSLKFGLVMTRIVNDLSAIKLWLARGLVSILVGSMVLATLITYLAISKPALIIVLGPALLVWLIIIAVAAPFLMDRIVKSRRARGRIASRAGTMMNARQTLLVHGQHRKSLNAVNRLSRRMNKALAGRAAFSGLFQASSDLVLPIMIVVLVTGMFGWHGHQAISSSDKTFLVLITALIVTQLNAMAGAIEYGMAYRVAARRFADILDQPAVDPEHGTVKLSRKVSARRLDAKALGFEPGQRPIHFAVIPGAHVRLTGGGPTLIRDLYFALAGLVKPVNGKLLLDGRECATFKQRHIWRATTLISDALPLTPGTVLENACLGAPSDLDPDEVRRLLSIFDLSPDDVVSPGDQGVPMLPSQAAALRCVRGLVRRAGLVLADDPHLLGDSDLMAKLLTEIAASGATLILGDHALSECDTNISTIDVMSEAPVAA